MSTKKVKFWKPGEMAEAARYTGIAQRNLSAILHRRRNVSPVFAQALQTTTFILFGKRRTVLAIHWIYNKTTKHPAFFTSRKKRK